MRQEKPHLFFIHLLRFLAFSDFSASRRHHSVSASYFGEGIVTAIPGVMRTCAIELKKSGRVLDLDFTVSNTDIEQPGL